MVVNLVPLSWVSDLPDLLEGSHDHFAESVMQWRNAVVTGLEVVALSRFSFQQGTRGEAQKVPKRKEETARER